MPNAEWGTKRICPKTGKRFYDLNRTPIISPYTGEVVELDLPGRKGSPVMSDSAKHKAPVSDVLDTEDDLLVVDVADDVDLEDELLDEEEDDTVSFDELSDVAGDEEDL
jgi:uncharacterized protein (TIGR02300 family)